MLSYFSPVPTFDLGVLDQTSTGLSSAIALFDGGRTAGHAGSAFRPTDHDVG
jgi:hypothetical protein